MSEQTVCFKTCIQTIQIRRSIMVVHVEQNSSFYIQRKFYFIQRNIFIFRKNVINFRETFSYSERFFYI